MIKCFNFRFCEDRPDQLEQRLAVPGHIREVELKLNMLLCVLFSGSVVCEETELLVYLIVNDHEFH